jgi:calcium permeable stress-gated cation channel
MGYSTTSIRIREIFVLGAMALLFFFWVFPTTALASLLSYQEIQKVLPWLGRLIDSNDQIRAIVQNSLPSFALILLNALLPFLLEGE